MAGFLGKGEVYIDRDLQGKFLPIGNAIKFAIAETEADVKERISRRIDTYGQALDRVALAKPAKITIELNEIDAKNLAVALRGLVEDVTDSGSVTGEDATAALGAYVKLAHDGIDEATVAVTNEDGSTTYTKDTDYEIRGSVGLLKALEGGDITDGQALKVDYQYNETCKKILGSKKTEIEGALILEGINMANNKACRVYVWKARLMPTSEVDFLAEDFTGITLEGTLLTPPNKTEPYEVRYVE
ncbi:MAG TPA: hypothetical protein ENF32_02585 [Thermosulfidibacter takaii]|uniref:Uncharacterized protein n=1 Tax=Thermosulfidibacter takaii TaxID=412593 RepID=A0A7C0U6E3_9BACT|nr:hypothetical protein [Thermosulfidibacter takaii]